MRILHITETMASGVLTYLQEVVRASPQEEHIIAYSGRRAFTPPNVADRFPKAVRLREIDISLRSLVGGCSRIKMLIREIRPDVIHLHSSVAGVLGRLAVFGVPGARVFYTPHGYSFLMDRKPFHIRAVYWLAEFILSQGNSRIVACSRSEFRHAKALAPLRKHELLENCLPPVTGSLELSLRSKRIVGMGRMEEQKDPLRFVEIAAALKRLDPDVDAVWIGDGRLRSSCEDRNRELGAGVRFTGWLTRHEAMMELRHASVFVQTSRWEGLPYSILEAMSVGLPVVASGIESHRDIFAEGEYRGFTVDDAESFALTIFMLLQNLALREDIVRSNFTRMDAKYKHFPKSLMKIYNKRG